MRDWTTIPIFQYSAWLLIAGLAIPLIAGAIARSFVFTLDPDDTRKNPEKARLLSERHVGAPETPEPEPSLYQPWPDF
jgi:hypothetical protein